MVLINCRVCQLRWSRAVFCSRPKEDSMVASSRRYRLGPSPRSCSTGSAPGRTISCGTASRDRRTPAAGNVPAPGDSNVQGDGGQPPLHPEADGVADDPVGPHVLDRAEVELASPMRCSVTSTSHNRFGPPPTKSRSTRSSCTGLPGLLPLPGVSSGRTYSASPRQRRSSKRCARTPVAGSTGPRPVRNRQPNCG